MKGDKGLRYSLLVHNQRGSGYLIVSVNVLPLVVIRVATSLLDTVAFTAANICYTRKIYDIMANGGDRCIPRRMNPTKQL